uniref:Uncharacterized protein n=1 Tax=Anguilla anguilla TaxID=7936 RepID=A0A0E9RAP3_ANGAN
MFMCFSTTLFLQHREYLPLIQSCGNQRRIHPHDSTC